MELKWNINLKTQLFIIKWLLQTVIISLVLILKAVQKSLVFCLFFASLDVTCGCLFKFVVQETNKQVLGSYTRKSPPASSTPSNLSPGSYNQGCAPQLQKDAFQSQAVNQQSPHSSYPSPSSKLGLVQPRQDMEPQGPHIQRGPLIGGQGGSQATSRRACTPTRGERVQHPHAQSSPANPPATSNNNCSSSVPYSPVQPHPGPGHQGRPPPPSLASSTSVPQQQQSGPHETWRYQSRPSSHSIVSTSQSCSHSIKTCTYQLVPLQYLVLCSGQCHAAVVFLRLRFQQLQL